MIDVPALAAPGGATPAARRKALAALPDEALAERLLPFVEALREGGAARWEPLATLAGLPLGEVVASPFGLRAIALGVRRGATSVQRELRRVLSWPAELVSASWTIPRVPGCDRATLFCTPEEIKRWTKERESCADYLSVCAGVL